MTSHRIFHFYSWSLRILLFILLSHRSYSCYIILRTVRTASLHEWERVGWMVGCRNSNSQLQIGTGSLGQMCWIQSANTVVLLVVSIQSSDKFWPGEENVGPVHCARTSRSYCPVGPPAHSSTWHSSKGIPGTQELAKVVWAFLDFFVFACVGQEAHWKPGFEPYFTYKESWSHLGAAGLSVSLKGDIWDLPKPVAKLTCAFGRMLSGKFFFPKEVVVHGWKEGEERAALSLAVAGVSGQSCCRDLVLITGSFLQSAELKRAPRKD